jgi:glycosyltransferase involved in cell wall biosynthesis
MIEVVSGLGMGGAEKSFLSRVKFLPDNFKTAVINTRPELDSWRLPLGTKSVDCSRNNIAFLLRLHQELRKISPNVVVVRSPIDLIALSLIKFFTTRNWKLVYEAHSIEISQNLLVASMLSPFMKFANSQTDLVIAVSKSVATGRQCRGAKKIKVHHVGALAKIQETGKHDFTFLFVARFVPLKQPIFFLEAVKSLADSFLRHGARVKMIGKGVLEPEIAKFIAANDLGKIVELSGYHEDLSSIYSSSEYLISTSLFEGLPITFFEAKLHGLRIISTPSSGDFDILGAEDLILKDFKVETLRNALNAALEGGLLTAERRNSIQRQNAWMQSEARSKLYYELIEAELIEAQ